MFEGLLPIGSVVLLKESTKKVMITGFLQKQMGQEGKIWDYTGVYYPQGHMGPDKAFLFDADQIDKIYFIGYQDDEQFAFKPQIDQLRKQIKNLQNTER